MYTYTQRDLNEWWGMKPGSLDGVRAPCASISGRSRKSKAGRNFMKGVCGLVFRKFGGP